MEHSAVAARLRRNPPRQRPLLVGLGGPTAAGKSGMAKALAEKYHQAGVCLIDQDSYYLDRGHLDQSERESLNYDEPGALDHDLLLRHLQSLVMGQAVAKPCYDFQSHTRTTSTQLMYPRPLIVLEGLYPFWDSRIRAILDVKVYVDADADMRLVRRLRRDILKRGRSAESVLKQYVDTVRPMQIQYVEPSRQYADLVLNTSTSFKACLAELIETVSERFYGVKARGELRSVTKGR